MSREPRGEIWSWPPKAKDKEKLKKEVDHSSMVGGGFNKQGIL